MKDKADFFLMVMITICYFAIMYLLLKIFC